MAEGQRSAGGSDLIGELAAINRTIRTVEDKIDNLRRKVQVIEKNMLQSDKKLFTEMRTTESDLSELKHELEDFRDKMKLLVKEIKLTATKEELTVLQKYISFFEPMNFVTKRDVKREIEEALFERGRK